MLAEGEKLKSNILLQKFDRLRSAARKDSLFSVFVVERETKPWR
jgi:hypothetical protein